MKLWLVKWTDDLGLVEVILEGHDAFFRMFSFFDYIDSRELILDQHVAQCWQNEFFESIVLAMICI